MLDRPTCAQMEDASLEIQGSTKGEPTHVSFVEDIPQDLNNVTEVFNDCRDEEWYKHKYASFGLFAHKFCLTRDLCVSCVGI